MISERQGVAEGIYGARESGFGGADHRCPVFDCSEYGHSEMQIFDHLPVVCRSQQHVRFRLADLPHKLWKIHVVTDGDGYSAVLRVTNGQPTVTGDSDSGFRSRYQAALEIRELNLTGGVEQYGLVLQGPGYARTDSPEAYQKVDALLSRQAFCTLQEHRFVLFKHEQVDLRPDNNSGSRTGFA